jgi:hypothetical protein
VFSIVFFGAQALDMLSAKTKCEDAILSHIEITENPALSREDKELSKVKHESICEAYGMKAKFYTAIYKK